MNTIKYIERTRDYYRAQGFKADYQWARNTEVPMHSLGKPLSECRATIITTAVAEPDIPKPIRQAASYFFDQAPAAFDVSELSWDKETTHTDDRQSYFPLEILKEFRSEGLIGDLAPRFHFVPTEYSQRHTLDHDAPATLEACIADEVDVAFLVPL